MKVLSIAAGLALAVSPLAVSNATSLSFGKPMMNSCYEAADMGRHDGRAFAHCEEALRAEMLSGDERAATLVNRGILWILDGNLPRAKQDFDAALIIDPAQPEAWLGKGIVEFRIGNGDAAFEPLDRAIQLRPRRPAVAYYVRGLANEEQGRLKAAYADLTTARQLDPNWPEPAMQLARYRVVRR
jgi:lipoprotein NlpI